MELLVDIGQNRLYLGRRQQQKHQQQQQHQQVGREESTKDLS